MQSPDNFASDDNNKFLSNFEKEQKKTLSPTQEFNRIAFLSLMLAIAAQSSDENWRKELRSKFPGTEPQGWEKKLEKWLDESPYDRKYDCRLYALNGLIDEYKETNLTTSNLLKSCKDWIVIERKYKNAPLILTSTIAIVTPSITFLFGVGSIMAYGATLGAWMGLLALTGGVAALASVPLLVGYLLYRLNSIPHEQNLLSADSRESTELLQIINAVAPGLSKLLQNEHKAEMNTLTSPWDKNEDSQSSPIGQSPTTILAIINSVPLSISQKSSQQEISQSNFGVNSENSNTFFQSGKDLTATIATIGTHSRILNPSPRPKEAQDPIKDTSPGSAASYHMEL